MQRALASILTGGHPNLPLSTEFALQILGLGIVVFLIVAYDILRRSLTATD